MRQENIASKVSQEMISAVGNLRCSCDQRERDVLKEATIEVSLQFLTTLIDDWVRLTRLEHTTPAPEVTTRPVGQNTYSYTLDKEDKEWMDAPLGPTNGTTVKEVAKIAPPKKVDGRSIQREKHGSVAQGAVVALAADYVPAESIASSEGLTLPQVRGILGAFNENIKAMRELSPGNARYAYLQEWFSWGTKETK